MLTAKMVRMNMIIRAVNNCKIENMRPNRLIVDLDVHITKRRELK